MIFIAKNIGVVILKAVAYLCLMVFLPSVLLANPDSLRNPIDPIELQSDTTSIYVTVQNVGGHEIPAIIQNEVPYLSVVDVFDFLKIRTDINATADSVYGFFISADKSYLIDKINNRITFAGKTFPLEAGDILIAESNMFLKMKYFGKIFGLECDFSFRNLTIRIKTEQELPVVKEMRQAQIRSNLSKLRGEFKADSVFNRRFPFLALGMADWMVIGNQDEFGKSTRVYLGLGGMFAGGEFRANINHYSNLPFTEKQQYYHWRYVNNDNKYLRQAIVGKISARQISSIFDPVVGVQFTNRPTTFRRSFGSYLLSDKTEPGWIVELYVNNVLVNYVKADDAGFYQFEVPLVYGSSNIKLRFFGAYGEERFSEQDIMIPFNFLPKNEWEYTVSAGIVEDSTHSRFSRAELNYGLGRRVTFGGGVEYLSSITNGQTMPFLSASAVLGSNLFFSTDYALGVRWKSVLNYRTKSNAQIELNYTKYHEGQTAIRYSYLEERKIAVSLPVTGKHFSVFSRFSAYQIVLPSTKYTNAEWTVSGIVYGLNGHITTYGIFTAQNDPFYYSNIGLSFRLPGKFLFTPQAQYEYNSKKLFSMKYEVGKYFSGKGYFNTYYERNFKSNFSSFGLSLRYDFSFAQMGLFSRTNGKKISTMQSASGSVLFDNKTGFLAFENRAVAGRGGILIEPFLDINGNGKKDKGEPKVKGLTANINGGITKYTDDTLIAISQLEAYSYYLLEVDDSRLENISWRLTKKRFKVSIDPYSFKTIQVPVSIMNELSGEVVLNENGTEKGMGRMIVNLYKKDGTFIGKTLTESDGSFNWWGLFSGECIIKLDPVQLNKLNFKDLQPDGISLTFDPSVDGEYKDGIKLKIVGQ